MLCLIHGKDRILGLFLGKDRKLVLGLGIVLGLGLGGLGIGLSLALSRGNNYEKINKSTVCYVLSMEKTLFLV